MSNLEIASFALGVAVADLFLSIALVVLPILWFGEDLSWETVNSFFGTTFSQGDTGYLILIAALSFLMTGLLNAGMAWALTRKLPYKRRT